VRELPRKTELVYRVLETRSREFKWTVFWCRPICGAILERAEPAKPLSLDVMGLQFVPPYGPIGQIAFAQRDEFCASSPPNINVPDVHCPGEPPVAGESKTGIWAPVAVTIV
jgi:hypothetical protein